MKRSLVAGLALSIMATLASTGGVQAAGIGIGFNIGNVSVGYSDGYWDNSHRWHRWGRGEAARYRSAHADMYHSWRHDDRHHH